MAMLAEPRQRKRYNLMPKGKALYEDDARFGTKMLEKMGWKKGEGLGVSSKGSTDFVRIRYKNDAFGLGFEQRDDQWTQHEQSFNGLLKTLNNEGSDDNRNKENEGIHDFMDETPARVGFGFQYASATEETEDSTKLKEKISGISLEARSKQSKVRVHYKKFTKGKDLAQYSEKDLANIFGKKATVEEEQANDFYKTLSNTFGVFAEDASSGQVNATVNGVDTKSDSASKKKDKKKKNQDKDMEKKEEFREEKQNNQQQTYISNLSMQDYFKMKMDAMKNKKKDLISSKKECDTNNPVDNELTAASKKKKKKSKREAQCSPDNCLQELTEKDSKKSKKNHYQEIFSENEIEKQVDLINDCIEESKSQKKKNQAHQEYFPDNESEEKAERKSKKNKTDRENFSESEKEPQLVKKAKKSKKRDTQETVEFQLDEKSKIENIEDFCIQEPEEKKLKKHKKTPDDAKPFESGKESEVAEIHLSEKKSKKKKKNKSKNKIETDLLSENKAAKKSRLEEPETGFSSTNNLLDTETDLVEKSTEKNKNELIETIEIFDSDVDEPANAQIQTITKNKKHKSKKSKESTEEISDNEETSPIACCTEIFENPPTDLPKEVSSSVKNISECDVNLEVVDLEELKKHYLAFNIYPISSFCAEKFRNISLNNFKGSTLSQIIGYGLSSDLQLDIQVSKYDEERITNLWKSALNKHEQINAPKKTYRNYIRQGVAARKSKEKAPKLNVKTWKRKSAFTF